MSSANCPAIESVLRALAGGSVTRTAGGFHVEATMTGPSAGSEPEPAVGPAPG
ncbi:MAG: hypothetical protein ACLQI7_13140 [Streptosporangiaceae bacterium]